jgi:hypothetical protein
MKKQAPYSNAEAVSVKTIERGDIIAFRDAQSQNWHRGVVYDVILRPARSDHPSAFLVLPIKTIGKEISPSENFPHVAKSNARIVEEAGGDPAKHQTITQFNLKTIVNVSLFSGRENQDTIYKVGSYAGSPFLHELMQGVLEHYKNGTLHKNNKPVAADTVIRISDPAIAERMRRENSALRRDAFAGLGETGTSASSIAEKIEKAVINTTLDEAAAKGTLSQVSVNFLKASIVPSTGKKAETLSDAFELVNNPEKLRETSGLKSGGKIYQNILSEVSSAMTPLAPALRKP